MADYMNRAPQGYDVEGVLLVAGTVTASGNGNAVRVGANTMLEIVASIRGPVSGTTPTLAFNVQEADTEGGTYTTIATFPTMTGVGEKRLAVRTTKPWVRAVRTAGGTTPSFGGTEVWIAS